MQLKSTAKKIELLEELNNNLNEMDGRIVGKLIQNQKQSSDDLDTVAKELHTLLTEQSDKMLGDVEKLGVLLQMVAQKISSLEERKNMSFIINHKLEAHNLADMRSLKVEFDYDRESEEIKYTLLANKVMIEVFRFKLEVLMKKHPEHNKAFGNLRVMLNKTVKEENLMWNMQIKALRLLLLVCSQEVIVDINVLMGVFEEAIKTVADGYIKKIEEKEEKEAEKAKAADEHKVGAALEETEKKDAIKIDKPLNAETVAKLKEALTSSDKKSDITIIDANDDKETDGVNRF